MSAWRNSSMPGVPVRKARRRGCLLLALVLAVNPVGVDRGLAQDEQDASRMDAAQSLVLDLQQVQLANLDLARRLADVERRAADLLHSAITDGALANAAERRLIDALIANATILASMALAPATTEATGQDSELRGLLEQNLAFVRQLQDMTGHSPGFRDALSAYALMQLQALDLGIALRRNRDRYDQVLAAAEARAVVPDGSFDPATRRWALQLPGVLPAVGSVSTSQLDEAATVTASIDQVPAIEASPSAGEPEVASDAVSTPPDVPAPPAIAPTGRDFPANELPSVAAIAPDGDRLPAGQGLDIVADDEVVTAPPTWTVSVDAAGRPVALAYNLEAPASSGIEGLRIGCSPNGTLRYTFMGEAVAAEYYIALGPAEGHAVRAESGVVRGSEAIRLSDALRRAFEAASSAGAAGRISVAVVDSLDRPAYLPVLGYLEARGRVLDGCTPYPEAADVEAAAPAPPPALGAPLTLDPTAGQQAGEEADAATRPVAPIPLPRPERLGPVELMGRT